ncbi:uncharacterized protein LOC134819404 [Bolinopsis microptera]|uniref:uncharacterized protein LOC134819404 n=1 Tax=Bolinopsis microptera TaxID=2820187 RepID=UPI0030791DA0
MKKWESYQDAVERELNTQAVVRDMKKREEEDRRIAKLAAAKDDARRRIGMIMAEAGALRASAVSNKKQELQRLQEQMLDRAEQRAAMLEAEKKEETERIERNQTEQYELVGKMRAQLEEYYGSLTREKAREERRSLWRIQRMKLNRLRRAHLMLEASHLNTELRQKLEENRPSGSQVIQSDVQGQGTQSDLGTVSNPETSPTLSQTSDNTDFISETVLIDAGSKTRKTWDQPINIKY